MSNQKSKVGRWFISVVMLASLLCAGYAAAKDKDQPQAPSQTEKGQGKDKAQPHVGSIFDDQADEFEEPTYTPPVDIEEKIKSIPSIPSNIMQHLKDKYKMKGNDFVSVDLQQTPDGSMVKYINIRGWDGDIRPKTDIMEERKEERLRSIAKAIIQEEVSLFRITDVEELKEFNFITEIINGRELTDIHYHRYIGDLQLEDGDISVYFGPDEKIRTIQAQVVAASADLYKAAAKKTLGRGKIYRIIRQELKTASGGEDVGMGVTKAYKVAIPKAPYVIWKVSVSTVDNAWNYKIDAFTGEILDKRSAMRSIR